MIRAGEWQVVVRELLNNTEESVPSVHSAVAGGEPIAGATPACDGGQRVGEMSSACPHDHESLWSKARSAFNDGARHISKFWSRGVRCK